MISRVAIAPVSAALAKVSKLSATRDCRSSIAPEIWSVGTGRGDARIQASTRSTASDSRKSNAPNCDTTGGTRKAKVAKTPSRAPITTTRAASPRAHPRPLSQRAGGMRKVASTSARRTGRTTRRSSPSSLSAPIAAATMTMDHRATSPTDRRRPTP